MKVRFVLLLALALLAMTLALAEDGKDSSAGSLDSEQEPSGTSTTPSTTTKTKTKKKKSTKDWSKVNFNDLEKEWEKGDSEMEREMEFEHSEKIMKKKAKEAREASAKAAKAKKAAAAAAEKKKKTKKETNKKTKKPATGNMDKDVDSEQWMKDGKKPTFKNEEGDWVPPPPGLENLDLSQAIGPGGKVRGQGGGGGMPAGLPEGFDLNNMGGAMGGGGGGGGGLPGAMGGGGSEKDMGPQMWFIEMQMTQKQGSQKGQRWTRKELDKLAAYWAEMLRTAHYSAKMYVLGEYKNDPETKEETGPTLLVSLDKAWQERAITKYIATQPETLKMTKDRQTITAMNFLGDDDDDDDEL